MRSSYTGPDEYRPLSPWAYWGLSILYTLPVIGLVFLIVFSINGKNINRRNFTRSYWCTLIAVLVVLVACLALAAFVPGLWEEIQPMLAELNLQ